jgi:hypothetical protein
MVSATVSHRRILGVVVTSENVNYWSCEDTVEFLTKNLAIANSTCMLERL